VALAEIARAVDGLPQDQRRVLLLVVLEGLTDREVAEVLDVPVGTVMSRLSRARQRLRLLAHAAADGVPLGRGRRGRRILLVRWYGRLCSGRAGGP